MEKRLAVPCDEADLVDQVKTLLPEGQAMALRDKGFTELPWAWLDARLVPYGLHHAHREIGRPEALGGVQDEDWTGRDIWVV